MLRAILPVRRPLIVLAHLVIVATSYTLAYLLRFDFTLTPAQLETWAGTILILLLVRLVVFWRFHLYEGLWQYVGTKDLRDIVAAVSLSTLIFTGVALVIYAYGLGFGFPRSVLIIDWLLCIGLAAGTRLAIREYKELRRRRSRERESRLLVVGAGDAGERLVREIQRDPATGYAVAGVIDDDPRKQHSRLHGLPVVGKTEQIPELARSLGADQVVLAIPSLRGTDRRRVVRSCLESRLPVKTVPTIGELTTGMSRIGSFRAVTPEDLLGRQAVEVDIEKLLEEISGQHVMITGAGGSIGSELCRQVASLNPELLVLVDRAESPLYLAERELRTRWPSIRTVAIVGDILDEVKVREVLTMHRPHVIYHAAAYKHVPLMEAQPLEAIQNNIFGTEIVASLAKETGTRKFVMISTDKAVRPVGIMGMTKRVAEDLCAAMNDEQTTFVSVRFGNVLGSAGSVVPLFEAQIARGEPVTITDPEATRYFMILAEAAQLVLQAGAMGRGGEVFFLDMGTPVKIGDLAENLIRLSGKAPGKDVKLEMVGLRPGERLSEQLVRESEELCVSEHEKIFLARGPGDLQHDFAVDFEGLSRFVLERDESSAVELLKHMAQR